MTMTNAFRAMRIERCHALAELDEAAYAAYIDSWAQAITRTG